jgi:hypothetical protein
MPPSSAGTGTYLPETTIHNYYFILLLQRDNTMAQWLNWIEQPPPKGATSQNSIPFVVSNLSSGVCLLTLIANFCEDVGTH